MDRQTLEECLVGVPFPELLQAVKHGQPHDILPLLDAELVRSVERIRRLNGYRNSISSWIHAMPPELLSRIFFIYATDANALYDLQWTKLLLVCRRWHEIGINTAELWAFISVHSDTFSVSSFSSMPTSSMRHLNQKDANAREVRRIELQRSRARQAALNVRMSLTSDDTDVKHPYTLMFWHPQSLSSLDLFGSSLRIRETLRIMALYPHPALKSLNVSEPFNFRFSFNEGGEEQRKLTVSLDDVLKQCSPHLQHLSVQEVLFSWPLINGLRELRVRYEGQAPAQHRVEDLIAALGRCPLLEQLHLHLPINSITTDTVAASAVLSCLASVYITADSSVCCTILHSLKGLPDSTQIATSVLDTSNMSVIDAITSYVGKHTHTPNSPVIRGVSVNRMLNYIGLDKIGITGQLCLERRRSYSSSLSEYHPQSTYVGLWAYTRPGALDSVNTFLTDAARSWSFANVSCLDLRSCNFTTSDDFWNDILGAIPTAQTVIVSAGSDVNFAEAFLRMLLNALREYHKRAIANIIIDISDIRSISSHLHGSSRSPTRRARIYMMRVLLYCAEAARAGCALDTVEVVSDGWQPSHALIVADADIDWSELYQDLNEGFVYEGVLHGSSVGPEGAERDSFAMLS